MLALPLLVCVSLLWSGGDCSAEPTKQSSVRAAHNALEGEYWYTVTFHETPIGSLSETRQLNSNRQFELKRSLEFRLTKGRVTRIHEILHFESEHPYGLLHAEETSSITSNGRTHGSTRQLIANEHNRDRISNFNYLHTFPFYQLAKESTTPGEERRVDFDRNDIVLNRWEVTGSPTHNPDLLIVQSNHGAITHVQQGRDPSLWYFSRRLDL